MHAPGVDIRDSREFGRHELHQVLIDIHTVDAARFAIPSFPTFQLSKPSQLSCRLAVQRQSQCETETRRSMTRSNGNGSSMKSVREPVNGEMYSVL